MVKCPNCNCELKKIKGKVKFAVQINQSLKETKEDLARKKELRKKLNKLDDEIISLGKEIDSTNLRFPDKIKKKLDKLTEKNGNLRWNWWEYIGTSIFQIVTPADLSKVVNHFIDSGMVVYSINGKQIYDRTYKKFFNREINSMGFNWK